MAQDKEQSRQPGQAGRSVYYDSGELLRSKQQQVRTESGRAFEDWALDQVPLHSDLTILDAGCGWGRFTWPLIEHFAIHPARLVAADLSLGMLQTAAQEAARHGARPHLVASSIAALPLPAQAFDGALASHVLYHVMDIEKGVRELARVLKPDGWLLATTNSDAIRVPILELHARTLAHLGIAHTPEADSPFSMENGAAALRTGFGVVETFYFEDKQIYPDAGALVNVYQTIGRYRNLLARPDLTVEVKERLVPVFTEFAQEIEDQEGLIRSPILMGAFVCREPIAGRRD